MVILELHFIKEDEIGIRIWMFVTIERDWNFYYFIKWKYACWDVVERDGIIVLSNIVCCV